MHYLIQVNIYLLAFFGFYVLFLRKETFYQANRFYLMLSGIMSFLIPFMQTAWVQSWLVTREVSQIMAGYEAEALEVPIISATANYQVSLATLLLGMYLVGILYFIYRFGKRIYRTVRWVSGFEENELQAFSFFGKVRVGKSLKQYKAIFDHERLHVVQCHSFDLVLFEVVGILCWMNPVVYLLKREIRLLHEYQADAYACRMAGSRSYYAALLVSHKFAVTPESILGNGFFTQSLLKARIKMLSKESSRKQALLKYGLIAPLFLSMMVLASASIAGSEKLGQIEQVSQELVFEKPVFSAVKEVRVDLTDFRKDGTIKGVSEEEDISLGRVEIALSDAPTRTVPPKVVPAPPKQEVKAEEPGAEDIFVGVEIQPEYPGGSTEMYRYLASQVTYPEAASRANVQGRVTVQFVVEKDGTVSRPRVLKGIGFGADEEAVRVVSGMPKWQPGSQNGRNVSVYYTIPILFTLLD